MAYHFCGCWFPCRIPLRLVERQYLPQIDLESHTTILATTSRTTLRQTFINTTNQKLDEVQYTFPLYDGVSVVGFKCTVASKTIVGIVKEKQQARAEYNEAVARGETAGLLEQLPEASDVFTTKVGNVPAGEKIHVEIVYMGELKHDAETDGSRFTIPTVIAPRYGPMSSDSQKTVNTTKVSDSGGIRILVDVALDEGSVIRGLQSPSHPIAVTMGRTSSMDEDAFDNTYGSATLTLGSTELDKDFIIIVLAKGQEIPRALLETHPTIPNHRALMTTLVPKFNIPSIAPEIVFVVDRSGSMDGKIPTLVAAMKIFLKSLPVSGIKFNICSFGSSYSFMFKKSKTYDQSSLQEALKHLDKFDANMGGTEMLEPIKETIKKRYNDMPLEVMVLTDGEIWNQVELFNFINEQKNARFFTLGIGHGASSALVEGIARAGNGFAQFVAEHEKMDKRVVRMLKGALTPHITDYSLEVRYDRNTSDVMSDDDFEVVESFKDSTKVVVTELSKPESKKKISLFDNSAKGEPTNPPAGRYDGLPNIDTPKILQTPHKIPSLFPFNRTTVYLLLGPDACQQRPKSVVLKGTSDHGPLELEIPVQDVGIGETIHQLAAKKAIHELEEGRGWITEAKTNATLLKTKYEGRWDLLVEREAVRLGVQFQVGGKWCSFVAVEKKAGEKEVSAESQDIIAGKSYLAASRAASVPFGSARKDSRWAAKPSSYGLSVPDQSRMQSCNTSAFSTTNTTSGLFGNAAPPIKFMRMRDVADDADLLLYEGEEEDEADDATLPESHEHKGGDLKFEAHADEKFEADSPPAYAAPAYDFGPGSVRKSSNSLSLSGGFGFGSGAPTGAMMRSSAPQQAQMMSSSVVQSSQAPTRMAKKSGPGLFAGASARFRKRKVSGAEGAAPASLSAPAPVCKPASHSMAVPPPPLPPSSVRSRDRYDPTIEDSPLSLGEQHEDESQKAEFEQLKERHEQKTNSISNEDKMYKLIEMQSFDGTWEANDSLWKLLGVSADKLAKQLAGVDSKKVRSTLLAVAWLESKMVAERDVWEMVVEKAKAWLEGQLGGESKVEELMGKAKGVF